MMRSAFSSFFILAAELVALFGLIKPVYANSSSKTLHVRAGQKIQPIIDTAPAGSTIIVDSGLYHEQLSISTSDITLIGRDSSVTLEPPSTPSPNPCSGLAGPQTEAGICIHGSGVSLAAFQQEHQKFISATALVRGVSVSGFTVQKFSGLGIAIVAGEDTRVERNRLVDNARYGALTVGSKNSKISRNVVASTVTKLLFIGVCMDDQANPRVADNDISGYNIALCVQTAGAEVRNNDVHGCCVGAFVDPGIVGAQIRGNHVSRPNPNCPDTTLNPDGLGVYGVFILGASETVVRNNRIEGQTKFGRADAPNWGSAGIVLIDLAYDGGVLLSNGNVVKRNTLVENEFDIFFSSEGTGNEVSLNVCTNALPTSACS